MTKASQSRAYHSNASILIALVIGLGTAFHTKALAKKAAASEEADLVNARNVFEEYKKLDQANDPKLVDLYAAEAKIESDIERKNAPTQKEKYDREKFCALITKTFADPTLAKTSATTVYDSPSVSREVLDKEAIKVEFRAYQGDTAMKVSWLLHKMPTGQWLIVKEHAATYRKSHGQAKP